MTLIDKIFKIGLLVVAVGFLVVYGYSRKAASSNRPPCGRYTVNISNSANTVFHALYMVDTEEGTVYYAEGTLDTMLHGKPLEWRVSKPKDEAKK